MWGRKWNDGVTDLIKLRNELKSLMNRWKGFSVGLKGLRDGIKSWWDRMEFLSVLLTCLEPEGWTERFVLDWMVWL